MLPAPKFVPTSVAKSITAMLRDTHQRRGIAILSGPPGIGKTTAIDAFDREFEYQVVIVKTAMSGKGGVRARMVMQEMVRALRRMREAPEGYVYLDTFQVKQQLATELKDYAGEDAEFMHLTFVFDEAQNLAKDAIEALRFWNDRDRCFGPFPIGLAFVGNAEFAMDESKGPSVISAAVADRALHRYPFTAENVEDADIRLVLAAHGITDELTVAAMVKRMADSRHPRSLRRLVETDIANLKAVAGDAPVTLDTMRQALAA